MSQSKNQHVTFIYEALPSLFHNQTNDFLHFIRQDGEKFLQFWWEQVGKNVGPENQTPGSGPKFELRELQDKTILILVTMPQPRAAGEAYFAALIYRPRRGFLLVRKPMTRIIVLEHTLNADGQPRTVLGECISASKYRKIKPGPEPTPEAFYEAVWEMLAKMK